MVAYIFRKNLQKRNDRKTVDNKVFLQAGMRFSSKILAINKVFSK